MAAMVEDDDDEVSTSNGFGLDGESVLIIVDLLQMPLKDGRKKKRDMDNFLEQLKREQAEREERLKLRAEQGTLVHKFRVYSELRLTATAFRQVDPL